MPKKFEVFLQTHKWAYVIAFPVLLPYALYKLLKALSEWGKNG